MMSPVSPPPKPPQTPSELQPEMGGSSAPEPGCDFYTARDSTNQRRFNLWLAAAMLAYLAATAALRFRDAVPKALPWLLVGLAVVLAIPATRSYLVFLRGADELLRKIQTEALALGFGAGVAFALLYPLLERLGAPKLDAEITAVFMMLACGAGAWFGTRRYSGSGAA